jgi:predicted nuclease of predicted toxin-antitoxin system
MKFIVDAQLPRRLAHQMRELGADAVHTLDLPARNFTTDSEIRRVAAAEQRVVVTKDRDFVDSFLMNGEPAKLLFITTGNIPNAQLEQLVYSNWQGLLQMLNQGDYVELSRTSLVLHM